MKDFSQFAATPYASRGLLRHFSDTRTAQGRVRFLLEDLPCGGHTAHLHAEGQGWSVQQACPSLQDAALLLAYLPQVPQPLYLQALGDLEEQQRFFAGIADGTGDGIDSAA